MSNPYVGSARKSYVCMRCGGIIGKGDGYYRNQAVYRGQSKKYIYCKNCFPDPDRFGKSKTKKMYELVRKKPRFVEELCEILNTHNVSYMHKYLVLKGFPIRKYRWWGKSSGGRKDRGSPTRFVIYYLKGDEKKAYRRIQYRFPEAKKVYWQRILTPLLGDAIRMGYGGAKCLVDDLDVNDPYGLGEWRYN